MHLLEDSLLSTDGGGAERATICQCADDRVNTESDKLVDVDVCIIGGGATGAYAAVRLREDLNTSVLVVEQDIQLGGHVNTYFPSGPDLAIDFGVLAYNNLPTTMNFFKRFDVPLEPAGIPPFEQHYIDLKTGKGFTPEPSSPVMALMKYAQVLKKYAYISEGYGGIPDPVPQELIEPFGKFVEDNELQAAVPIIWIFAFGVGNVLKAPTLLVIKDFGLLQINDLFTGGFLTTSNHNNSELYHKAATLLGKDVLYGSTVLERTWDDKDNNLIRIATPTGTKMVRARRLLISIPPTLANMQPFNLDVAEQKLFGKWTWLNSYVAVISETGLPDGIQIINVDPESPQNLPQLPFIWHYDYSSTPGYFTVKVMGDSTFTADDAKKLITESLARIQGDGTVLVGKTPTIEAFASHSPLQLHPSPEALKAGFYKKLYALQGNRNTFYTGHAWAGDYTSVLWRFTDRLLPALSHRDSDGASDNLEEPLD